MKGECFSDWFLPLVWLYIIQYEVLHNLYNPLFGTHTFFFSFFTVRDHFFTFSYKVFCYLNFSDAQQPLSPLQTSQNYSGNNLGLSEWTCPKTVVSCRVINCPVKLYYSLKLKIRPRQDVWDTQHSGRLILPSCQRECSQQPSTSFDLVCTYHTLQMASRW